MGLTVAELREYLAGLPGNTPVVVDVNAGRWYLRAESIDVTSDQNATNAETELEVQITWEIEGPGWVLSDGDPEVEVQGTDPAWPFPKRFA
jgi:hypothetical protein